MRWYGVALGRRWNGALHSKTQKFTSMFSGVPAQCKTKANIQISSDGARFRNFKI